MHPRKNLLINRWEQATDVALAEAAARCGVRVFAKVRVASALPIDRSGLTAEEFSYALRAEFDFVVADGERGTPQFAIEFDEHHHLTDATTIARDRLKSAVCRRFALPLVRIDSAYLRRERRFTLIGYLLEAWHMERSFDAAQERGEIPPMSRSSSRTCSPTRAPAAPTGRTGSTGPRGSAWSRRDVEAASCRRHPSRSSRRTPITAFRTTPNSWRVAQFLNSRGEATCSDMLACGTSRSLCRESHLGRSPRASPSLMLAASSISSSTGNSHRTTPTTSGHSSTGPEAGAGRAAHCPRRSEW